MNEVDLLNDIKNTESLKSNIFEQNSKDPAYLRYLELLREYCSESKKPRYLNLFNYFIDDNGNFVKEAKNPDYKKDEYVLTRPKFININNELNQLKNLIKDTESKLRKLRSNILVGNLDFKEDFDLLKKQYDKFILDRDLIIETKNKNDNDSEISTLKKQNILLNLNQEELKQQISLSKKLKDATNLRINSKNYLQNNEIITDNQKKIRSLKEVEKTNFLILEVPENKKPKKTKIKKQIFKVNKKSKTSLEAPSVDGGLSPYDLLKESTKEKLAPDLSVSETIVDEEPEEEDISFNTLHKLEEVETAAEAAAEAEFKFIPREKEQEKVKLPIPLEENNNNISEDIAKLIPMPLSPGNHLELDENQIQNKKPIDEDVLGLETLDLGDDLESLQPDFPEEDDVLEEFKFNKNKEDVQNKKEDEAIPDFLNQNKETEVVMSKPENNNTRQQETDNIPQGLDIDKLYKQVNKKANRNIKIVKVDPDLKFSSLKSCDDSKTKRSSVETFTKAKKGRKPGNLDLENKNCIFPYKEVIGRGKNKKEIIHEECQTNKKGDQICATERNKDCTMKKFSYCKEK